MIYIMATVSGSVGPMINLSIFIIFQLVLGISFLRLKMRLAERIVREQENAEIDVLTGFANRRVYEKDLGRLSEEGAVDGLIYIAIDMNELKEVNDTHGNDAGDRLIVGAAECIAQCFGEKGRMYRIGGDEFAVILPEVGNELPALLGNYEKSMKAWSEQNGMPLSTAYGFVCWNDYPGEDIAGLARAADKKMYEAKASYYQNGGRDRRGRHAR